MARRPIEEKKRRRVAKAFRRAPLPAYFNLVDWLVSRKHAASKREARELILAGRVKSGSHPVGIQVLPVLGPDFKIVEKETVNPFVPVSARADLLVSGE